MNQVKTRLLRDYLVLLLLTGLVLLASLFLLQNKSLVRLVLISYSGLYFIWGMVHHLHEGTFCREIVVEYALFTLIGLTLIWGLL